jgi:hypothetical protein
MLKADKIVCKETKYIALFCIALGIVMQMVFLAMGRWDYRVLLGNMLSLFVSVSNFYLMGISVQKALSMDSNQAGKLVRSSQGLRNIGIFIFTMIGVLVPWFNTVAVIVPLFFPRIAVSARPIFDKKEVS